MDSETASARRSLWASTPLHIAVDIGIVLALLFFPNHYWAQLQAAHLQPHLFMPAVAVLFVYGTAIARERRGGRILAERAVSLALLLGAGWVSDGLMMAFLRFAFMEVIALSISLGACLVLYRFIFGYFSAETLAKTGSERAWGMFREYWTEGFVLPIIVFGVPLLVWSGFALEPLLARLKRS